MPTRVQMKREMYLGRILSRIRALPPGRLPSTPLLILYSMLWGNPGYAASIRYLRRICRNMVSQDASPVLECGSGSSTLLLGALAEKYNRPVHSLEHHAAWAGEMRRLIKKFGLVTVTVHYAPLQVYGDYTWYSLPEWHLSRPFGFVVCDGPPSNTPGGRIGLLPTLEDQLSDQCVILLDDTYRRAEKKVLQAWEHQRPLRRSNYYAVKGFTEVAFI